MAYTCGKGNRILQQAIFDPDSGKVGMASNSTQPLEFLGPFYMIPIKYELSVTCILLIAMPAAKIPVRQILRDLRLHPLVNAGESGDVSPAEWALAR